jgi:hypothetical protein
VVATDRRLIYRGGLGGKALQSELTDLPYSSIKLVSFGGGLRWMGQRQTLTIITPGESIEIKGLHNRDVDTMVNFIRQRSAEE